MQNLLGLAAADFEVKTKQPISRLELQVDPIGSLNYDNLVGAFDVLEEITGGTSGATAIVRSDDGSTLILDNCSGKFHDNEQITGGTSGATADVNHPDSGVGVDLVQNGDFSVDTDPPPGWVAGTGCTLTTEAGGKIGNCMKVLADATGTRYTSQEITTVIGKVYKVTVYAKDITTGIDGKIKIGTAIAGAQYYDSGTITADAWTAYTVIFEATTTTTYITLYCIIASQAFYFDEISCYSLSENLCDLDSKNYLIEANYSSGQRELSYCPIAAEFTAIIDDIDGNLNPKNDEGIYNSFFKIGRKVRFWTGFKIGASDYLWKWFVGVISDVQINNSANQITIKGFDYAQYLTEVKLKSPDNYWGAVKDTVTVADQADYSLTGLGCNGAYIAYLDGTQIYAPDTWIYDKGIDDATKKFWFLPSSIPAASDLELLIYYYTSQAPENVVADILVTAGLYDDRAAALAAMDYEATGVTIDRVRFNTGVSALYAIQKICERVDYEFFFKYDGTPVFRSIATVGAADFTFGKELISTFKYIENIDEVRNHIIIEGEEYSTYDPLLRILDGTEIMFDLDDVPDGDSYVRMPLTSVSAGKIIIAGCDAEVTDRMFTNPTAKGNIEAWMKAGDTTYIDGGFIYTSSIVVAGLNAAVTDRMFGSSTIKTNIEAWRHASDTTLIDGGDIYTNSILANSIAAKTLTLGEVSDDAFTEIGHQNLIKNSVFNYDGQNIDEPVHWHLTVGGTWENHFAWKATAPYKKYPWEYAYNSHQAAENNDGAGVILLAGDEYIPVERTDPYTLSVWVRKVSSSDVIKWYLGLFFYDSDKVACDPAIGYPTSMEAISDTSDSWTRYSGTFGPNSDDYDVAFPADCKYVRIRFYPIYHPAAGTRVSSLATGLQFEPGDKLTNWKPHQVPEEWMHGADATYIDGGKVYTNSITTNQLKISDSDNVDEKLLIYQGTDVTELIDYKGTGVNHQITNWGGWGSIETDTFLTQRISDPDRGGIWWCSLADGLVWASWAVYAFMNAYAATVKDGTTSTVIVEEPLLGDATNHTYGHWNANANIWGIRTVPAGANEKMVFFVDEDGDYFHDGAGSGFQDEDDIQLVKEVEEILTSKISRTKMKEKDVFKKHKIVHVSEVEETFGALKPEDRKKLKGYRRTRYKADGKGTRLDRYISGKKMNLLFMGAIRQLEEKNQTLKERIDKLEARLR